mmetsp:Transcript_27935/g.71236  ORF Transcript_27935/g.71236 Transcript_27935/m.71236 type:complete len:267 (-) Transcript_27935:28-828(-)
MSGPMWCATRRRRQPGSASASTSRATMQCRCGMTSSFRLRNRLHAVSGRKEMSSCQSPTPRVHTSSSSRRVMAARSRVSRVSSSPSLPSPLSTNMTSTYCRRGAAASAASGVVGCPRIDSSHWPSGNSTRSDVSMLHDAAQPSICLPPMSTHITPFISDRLCTPAASARADACSPITAGSPSAGSAPGEDALGASGLATRVPAAVSEGGSPGCTRTAFCRPKKAVRGGRWPRCAVKGCGSVLMRSRCSRRGKRARPSADTEMQPSK